MTTLPLPLLLLQFLLVTAYPTQSTPSTAVARAPPWLDTRLAPVERARALVAAMHASEKPGQLATDHPGAAAIPRLGVPAYSYWTEASHGIAWAGRATVFPCALAQASSFDVGMVRRVGTATAVEGRAKHHDHVRRDGNSTDGYAISYFAPNINIVRDIRWGRSMETSGEDPHLTGRMAVAVISGLQRGNGTSDSPYLLGLAMAKHFAAYSVESNYAAGGTDGQYRLSADFNVSDADLRQTYIPAFEAAIREGDARSLMCSYNSVRKTKPKTQDDPFVWLL
jgi:beta-glucosidase